MELTHHSEYHTYTRDREIDQRCRQALAAWKASGEPILAEAYSLRWTPESTQAFMRSLSHLFQKYNRVLWEQFPYCRQCGGQCCLTHTEEAGVFDSIALALLGKVLPTLPKKTGAAARGCTYLSKKGCVWPAVWRPMTCWAYYCPGRGILEHSDAWSEHSGAIATELELVVLDLLPDELRRYEQVTGDSLVIYLSDPLDFAEAFNDALFEIFVAPFDDRYSVIGDE
jgi:hypothetical protein